MYILKFIFIFLSFIYFTSFGEKDKADINSLRWSVLVGLEPAWVARSTTVLWTPTIMYYDDIEKLSNIWYSWSWSNARIYHSCSPCVSLPTLLPHCCYLSITPFIHLSIPSIHLFTLNILRVVDFFQDTSKRSSSKYWCVHAALCVPSRPTGGCLWLNRWTPKRLESGSTWPHPSM